MSTFYKQNFRYKLWFPVMLSLIGGYVAMLSLSMFGSFVNCMSGNATRIGMAISQPDYQLLVKISTILLFFITGSFAGTFIFDQRGHITGLISEALLLLAVALLPISISVKMYLAAMAMGIQNASSTCISWNCGKIRTTHVTGPSTDVGIALARKDFDDFWIKTATIVAYIIGAFTGNHLIFLGLVRTFVIATLAILIIVFFEILSGSRLVKKYLSLPKSIRYE